MALLCAGGAAPARAGAWTLKTGEGQLISSLEIAGTSRFYDNSGRLERGPDTRQVLGQLYAEYGLTDSVTLVGQLAGKAIAQDQPGMGERWGGGLEDPQLGARVRLWTDPGSGVVASVQGLAILPGAYATDRSPTIGTGHGGFELRGLLGLPFTLGDLSGFADLSLGYRQRFGPAPNEWRPEATVGLRVAPDWLVMAQSLNTISDHTARAPQQTRREHKLGLSVAYSLTERWTVQAGAWHTVAGRNTGALSAVVLAVWYRF